MNEVDFKPGDWQGITEDYSAWWKGELPRPLVYFSNVRDGASPPAERIYEGFIPNYPPELALDDIIDGFLDNQSGRKFPADTFPYWFINFGAGVLAVPLGAALRTMPETVWFEPPEGAAVTDLDLSLDADNYWWKRILDLTRRAVERIGDVVAISYSDIGGNLDILASLIGSEQLMLDLVDHPQEVKAAVDGITEAWKQAFDDLDAIIDQGCPGRVPWAPTWAPGRTYMLQSDASYMISPEMCAEFVIPDLADCSNHLDYAFYHMDGIGQIPHLDLFLSIENLRGIQWIPGDGKPEASQWTDLLSRIRNGGKLSQFNTSARGALELCRTIGARGFLMAISDPLAPHEAEELFKEICRLSR